jgi:competence ComEA-like helix-hairpin-helix protein
MRRGRKEEQMVMNLKKWIGTLGTLAVIGSLALATVPELAKSRKPSKGRSVVVSKTDKKSSATKLKKTRVLKSVPEANPAGQKAKAPKEKKAPKSAKQKLAVGTQVNINTASAEEIAKLPRVGLKMAERIVEYRTAHKGFRSLDELRNVKGVGAKVLEGLKPFATL